MASERDPHGLGEWPESSAKRLILGELAAFAIDKLEEADALIEGAAVVVETADGVWWFGSGSPIYTRGLLEEGLDALAKRREGHREENEEEAE